jgi:hypothetical protein
MVGWVSGRTGDESARPQTVTARPSLTTDTAGAGATAGVPCGTCGTRAICSLASSEWRVVGMTAEGQEAVEAAFVHAVDLWPVSPGRVLVVSSTRRPPAWWRGRRTELRELAGASARDSSAAFQALVMGTMGEPGLSEIPTADPAIPGLPATARRFLSGRLTACELVGGGPRSSSSTARKSACRSCLSSRPTMSSDRRPMIPWSDRARITAIGRVTAGPSLVPSRTAALY